MPFVGRRYPADIRFSEDIVPLTDLKANPERVVRQVEVTHRSVIVTCHRCGVAVLLAIRDFEQAEEAHKFMRAAAARLLPDLSAEHVTVDAVQRLSLKQGQEQG